MIIIVIYRMRMRLCGMWFVEIYKALHGMWFVVLNANFIHFYQLHPYPSPRPGKCCHLKKTPENSTLREYCLILPAYDTKRSHFFHYRTKIRKMADQNRRVKKMDYSTLRITWYNFFVKHNLPSLSKSYLLSFTQLFISWKPL